MFECCVGERDDELLLSLLFSLLRRTRTCCSRRCLSSSLSWLWSSSFLSFSSCSCCCFITSSSCCNWEADVYYTFIHLVGLYGCTSWFLCCVSSVCQQGCVGTFKCSCIWAWCWRIRFSCCFWNSLMSNCFWICCCFWMKSSSCWSCLSHTVGSEAELCILTSVRRSSGEPGSRASGISGLMSTEKQRRRIEGFSTKVFNTFWWFIIINYSEIFKWSGIHTRIWISLVLKLLIFVHQIKVMWCNQQSHVVQPTCIVKKK